MTTAIQLAMKDAGIPIKPLRERLWLWIKDHPHATVESVAAAMKEEKRRIRNNISEAVKQGLVESHSQHGTTAKTYTASGDSYADALKFGRRPTKVTNIRPVPGAPKPAPVPSLAKLPKELDGYTIGQLRALRDTLNQVFA